MDYYYQSNDDSGLTRQAAQQADMLSFAERDLNEFMQRHGNVDVMELMNDPRFLRFGGSRIGRESLADLYDDYVSVMTGGDTGTPQAQTAQTLPYRPREQGAPMVQTLPYRPQEQGTPQAQTLRSMTQGATGAASASIAPAASGISGKSMLTPVQRNSLRDWNRSQPSLAMSEQEYLSKR